jgi:membrane-associated protease RseP (regulator of RpoE activity)
MRKLTWVLITIVLNVCIGSAAKASADLGRLAIEFETAWAAAGGPAPPLGVALVDLTENERSTLGITDGRGIRLTAVNAGSLGERLGLEVNDIIVGLNGNPVRSGEEFVNLARSRDPAVIPYFEVFISNSASSPAAGAPMPQTGSTPIDCGPNPTVECAMQMLRDSWSKLREAVR